MLRTFCFSLLFVSSSALAAPLAIFSGQKVFSSTWVEKPTLSLAYLDARDAQGLGPCIDRALRTQPSYTIFQGEQILIPVQQQQPGDSSSLSFTFVLQDSTHLQALRVVGDQVCTKFSGPVAAHLEAGFAAAADAHCPVRCESGVCSLANTREAFAYCFADDE